MGSYRSGRPRLRRRVEDVPRFDALEWCRSNGVPTVARRTGDGDPYFVGTCPKCERGVWHLFRVEGRVVCRQCAGLVYRSQSECKSEAARVRADPKATGAALQTLREFISTGDAARFNDAMKTLAVSQHISPLDRLPAASDAEAILTEEVLLRILADDLQTSTGLVEIIKAQILAGMENTTNRRGDTLAKLSAAWATVSNVRASRAAQVAQLLEKRAQEGAPQTTRALMLETMKATGYRTPSGHTIEELEAIKRG